jgi:hypothetical protein
MHGRGVEAESLRRTTARIMSLPSGPGMVMSRCVMSRCLFMVSGVDTRFIASWNWTMVSREMGGSVREALTASLSEGSNPGASGEDILR